MYDLNGRNVGQYGIIKLGGIKEMQISPAAELIPKLKQKTTNGTGNTVICSSGGGEAFLKRCSN